MDIITLLVVGSVAGLLASAFMRGWGFGVLGDIALGILGAFVGSWAFRELRWDPPVQGIAGVAVVAFVGAVLVLVSLRFFKSVMTRP